MTAVLAPTARVRDLSNTFLALQVRALHALPPAEGATAARLLAQIESEIDLLTETVRLMISDRQYEDALALIDRMRGLTFDGAGAAPPAIGSIFIRRRDQTVTELYAALAQNLQQQKEA